MMTKHQQSPSTQQEEALSVPGRRRFMNSAALAGLATVVACTDKGTPAAAPAASASAPTATAAGEHVIAGLHPKPGELDTYYGLWSGGHTGDMRVMGMPSGREIHRIPMFVPDALVGWGITNESKKVMGTKPDGSLRYTVGDTHHVHASYKDGNYDGRYAWINDKINSRLGRVQLDYFICDKITELPNVQGFHGIFPDKRDPLDPKINYTTRVFCGGEFAIPLPNTAGIDDPSKYRSLFTCVDAETMEVRWQVLIDGNCDLVATSYDGKLAATNQYNTEMGVHYEDMMSAERDACLFFNVARIEAAVKAGKFKTIGDSKVPVVDGTHAANQDPKTALTAYVSVPKNPHGVNASPDQKYFVCAGKLSPTGTVIELSRVLDWFDGKLAKIDDAIVAEVELGLGPLHTAFDGRGNAYTTLFLDSQIVKWNIDAAIKFHNGDKNAKYVVDRLDVHYQPGHLSASQSETMAADGKFPRRGLQVLQGPLPARWPAAPRKRTVHRHLRRQDGAAAGPPDPQRAARLHHLQARAAAPEAGLFAGRFPAGHQGPEAVRRGAQWQEGDGAAHLAGTGVQPARVQAEEGRRGHADPHQSGQGRGSDARLRDSEIQHQLHRQSAGNRVGHVHCR